MMLYDVIRCFYDVSGLYTLTYDDIWCTIWKKNLLHTPGSKKKKMCCTKQKKKIGSTKYFSVFFADPWSSDAQLSITGVYSLNSQNWRNFTVEKKRPFFSPPHRHIRLWEKKKSHGKKKNSHRREVVKKGDFWTYASRFWPSR